MTIERWQRFGARRPLNHLSTLHDEINRLFQSTSHTGLLDENTQPFLSGWVPAIDVYEDEQNLYVRAEVPGMKKEDIQVSLHEEVLTLSGERSPAIQPQASVYRSERSTGKFQRSVALPLPVVGEKVQASYRDGILTVTLPRAEEAKPRQIQVSVK